jgi:hypothetical protein
MLRLTSTTIAANLMGFAALTLAIPAQAGTINGSFETGDLTGWNSLGSVSVVGSFEGVNPTDGSYQALLQTPQAENYTELEAFLGLTPGNLDTVGFGEVFGGSAVQQSFIAAPGDILTLNWALLSQDTNQDFAFVVVLNLNGLVVPLSDAPSAPTFGTFSTVLLPGAQTLSIGVVNVVDGEVQTKLLVDQVAVTSVPVPTPALLPGFLTLGLSVFTSTRYSKKSGKSSLK